MTIQRTDSDSGAHQIPDSPPPKKPTKATSYGSLGRTVRIKKTADVPPPTMENPTNTAARKTVVRGSAEMTQTNPPLTGQALEAVIQKYHNLRLEIGQQFVDLGRLARKEGFDSPNLPAKKAQHTALKAEAAALLTEITRGADFIGTAEAKQKTLDNLIAGKNARVKTLTKELDRLATSNTHSPDIPLIKAELVELRQEITALTARSLAWGSVIWGAKASPPH